MSTSVPKYCFAAVTVLIVSLFSPVCVSHAQTTNWVAYNDMIPNYGPAVNGWITHPRATGIDMGEAGGSGNLTNFLDGQ